MQLSVEGCRKGRALENIRDSGLWPELPQVPTWRLRLPEVPTMAEETLSHCREEKQRTQTPRVGSQWPLALATHTMKGLMVKPQPRDTENAQIQKPQMLC